MKNKINASKELIDLTEQMLTGLECDETSQFSLSYVFEEDKANDVKNILINCKEFPVITHFDEIGSIQYIENKENKDGYSIKVIYNEE